MNYGQIIFHLEDYYNYGGIISTSSGGIIQPILNPLPPSENEIKSETKLLLEDGSINIYKNLISTNKEEWWNKVGVQAPPGTKIQLNDKEIIIGPSGIYELSNVIISNFYFVPLTNYKKNEEETQKALTDGKKIMQDALNSYNYQTKGMDLNDKDVIELYKQLTEIYIKHYEAGYNQYQVGLNGVYEADENDLYQLQKNIIIDYRMVDKEEVSD